MILNDLEYLMALGGIVYKKDLALGLDYDFEKYKKTINGSVKIKRMIEKKYVIEVDKKKYNTAHELIKLTPEGIKYIATKKNISLKSQYETAPKQFESTTSKIIKRSMVDVRTNIAMLSVGLNTLPSQKPSLEYLYTKLSGAGALIPTQNYQDYLEPEQLVEKIKQGIFYTDSEVRKFIETISKTSDTILTSKFSGLCIIQDKLLIVFTEEPSKNKAIVFYSKPMKTILHSLMPLKSITQAYRVISNFGPKHAHNGKYIPIKEITSEPYALIISNGYEKIYASVIGNKFGKLNPGETIDGIDNREKARKDRTIKRREAKIEATYLLRADLNPELAIFRRTFVIPFNTVGLNMLYYLIHTPLETWYEQSKTLFSNKSQGFASSEDDSKIIDQLFPGSDLNYNSKAIFMPVPELNTLRKIYEDKEPVSIVTIPELLEPIARSIRMEQAHYYTVPDLHMHSTHAPELTEQLDVGIYASSGRFAGRDILESYLAEKNLAYTENECRKLPTLNGQSQSQFWNDVYNKKISFEQVEKLLMPLPIKEKKTYYHKKSKSATVGPFTEESYKNIKRYCSMKGISVRHLMNSIVMPEIKKLLLQMELPEPEIVKPITPSTRRTIKL